MLGLRSFVSLCALPLVTAAASCQRPADKAGRHPAPQLGTVLSADSGSVGAFPDEAFRSKRPEAAPPRPFTPPSLSRFRLDNGLEVFLVEDHRLPLVRLRLEFDTGGIDDPPSKVGLADLCMDLLDEGTRGKDRSAFALAQDDIAVSLRSGAGQERSSIELRALRSQLEAAMGLLDEMLLEPGLRPGDLERIKTNALANLRQTRGDASRSANRLFRHFIWGDKHPYGALRSEPGIHRISRKDCRNFVQRLRPMGSRLWVAGHLGPGELKQLLEQTLAKPGSKWRGQGPTPKPVPPAKLPQPVLYFVQLDGAAQSMIMAGFAGAPRNPEDYEATFLMTQILGGSFSSRINMNLREDKGYAYGARAGIRYLRQGSRFRARAPVETTVTAPALREIAKELRKIREQSVKADELSREQQGVLQRFPGKFSTPWTTVSTYRNARFFGLPDDYYSGYRDRFRSIDAEAIHASAQTRLREDKLVVVVAGDGKRRLEDGTTVLEDLRKLVADGVLGLESLALVDPNGKRLPTAK